MWRPQKVQASLPHPTTTAATRQRGNPHKSYARDPKLDDPPIDSMRSPNSAQTADMPSRRNNRLGNPKCRRRVRRLWRRGRLCVALASLRSGLDLPRGKRWRLLVGINTLNRRRGSIPDRHCNLSVTGLTERLGAAREPRVPRHAWTIPLVSRLLRNLWARHHLLDHTPIDSEDSFGRGKPPHLRCRRTDETLHCHQTIRHLLDPLHRLVYTQQPW
mmetsp:Transcript_59668/g.132869  ORF Transcript_59668/g.132869 Transcript_59668/m.132869 type:complete len:216 (+) Transcript_59668:1547-2194(+)